MCSFSPPIGVSLSADVPILVNLANTVITASAAVQFDSFYFVYIGYRNSEGAFTVSGVNLIVHIDLSFMYLINYYTLLVLVNEFKFPSQYDVGGSLDPKGTNEYFYSKQCDSRVHQLLWQPGQDYLPAVSSDRVRTICMIFMIIIHVH